MIDTAVILFSTIMCVIVVFRAIKLDGQLPWFGAGKSGAGDRFSGKLAKADPDAA